MNVKGQFRYATRHGVEGFHHWRVMQQLGAGLKAACGLQPGQCEAGRALMEMVRALQCRASMERRCRGRARCCGRDRLDASPCGTPAGSGSSGAGVLELRSGPAVQASGQLASSARSCLCHRWGKALALTLHHLAPLLGPAHAITFISALQQQPSRFHRRAAALEPGGPITRRFFAPNPVVLQVGSTVFAHAGILPDHVEYGLAKINKARRGSGTYRGLWRRGCGCWAQRP